MKLVLNIPEEFESDYRTDDFNDCFQRVLADIKDGKLCGKYEKETIEMLAIAFQRAKELNE